MVGGGTENPEGRKALERSIWGGGGRWAADTWMNEWARERPGTKTPTVATANSTNRVQCSLNYTSKNSFCHPSP